MSRKPGRRCQADKGSVVSDVCGRGGASSKPSLKICWFAVTSKSKTQWEGKYFFNSINNKKTCDKENLLEDYTIVVLVF